MYKDWQAKDSRLFNNFSQDNKPCLLKCLLFKSSFSKLKTV